jgi:hypothetical protein
MLKVVVTDSIGGTSEITRGVLVRFPAVPSYESVRVHI